MSLQGNCGQKWARGALWTNQKQGSVTWANMSAEAREPCLIGVANAFGGGISRSLVRTDVANTLLLPCIGLGEPRIFADEEVRVLFRAGEGSPARFDL